MQELLYSLITLPFIKKDEKQDEKGGSGKEANTQTKANAEAASCLEEKEELADFKLKSELYKTILLRYQDMIEQSESKTIAEMKGMIRPEDKSVIEMKDSIIATCHPYIYEEKFPEAFKMAVSRLCMIKTVKLPIEFWLSNDFSEMLALGAGDGMDKAIFLCSLLRALGNSDVWVVVTSARKSYVVSSFWEESTLVDVETCEQAGGPTREEVLKALSEKSKVLYAFNDKEYEEHTELSD